MLDLTNFLILGLIPWQEDFSHWGEIFRAVAFCSLLQNFSCPFCLFNPTSKLSQTLLLDLQKLVYWILCYAAPMPLYHDCHLGTILPIYRHELRRSGTRLQRKPGMHVRAGKTSETFQISILQTKVWRSRRGRFPRDEPGQWVAVLDLEPTPMPFWPMLFPLGETSSYNPLPPVISLVFNSPIFHGGLEQLSLKYIKGLAFASESKWGLEPGLEFRPLSFQNRFTPAPSLTHYDSSL